MATKITDFAATARLWQTFGPIETDDASITGAPVDLIEGDGPAFAIVSVGAAGEGVTVSGTVQASADTSNWTDVDGATFEEATGPGVRAITFTRPKRYLRIALTVADAEDPVPLAVLIGQSRKIM